MKVAAMLGLENNRLFSGIPNRQGNLVVDGLAVSLILLMFLVLVQVNDVFLCLCIGYWRVSSLFGKLFAH